MGSPDDEWGRHNRTRRLAEWKWKGSHFRLSRARHSFYLTLVRFRKTLGPTPKISLRNPAFIQQLREAVSYFTFVNPKAFQEYRFHQT